MRFMMAITGDDDDDVCVWKMRWTLSYTKNHKWVLTRDNKMWYKLTQEYATQIKLKMKSNDAIWKHLLGTAN